MGPTRNDELASLKEELIDQLRPYRQEHLIRYWDELSQLEKMSLATQIAQMDLGLIDRLSRHTVETENLRDVVDRAEPPTAFRLGKSNPFTPDQGRARGESALRSGEIAAVLVAGGQGTRLSFDHPKGMYPIGPLSKATLFQLLFEKLIAVRRRYSACIPLVLMTSPTTHEETLEYLDAHDRFGLPADDLLLITQGTMPAVDRETGKLLLSTKASLFLSPDGHGGIVPALQQSGIFEKLEARGVRHLFYFQVDNPLVKVCDPEFIGYHLLEASQASTLAVAKHHPKDKVGNILAIDGRLRIIEYSEFNQLPDATAGKRNANGSLRFWAGNTAIHVFDLSFLMRMAQRPESLPFHVAEKKVPYLDENGRLIEPSAPNALKFERFIFDLLPAAERAIVVETDEAETFAPVKNAPGSPNDSPETARAQMIALHTRWLEQAGARVAPGTPVEISPGFALDVQQLRERITSGVVVDRPTYFR